MAAMLIYIWHSCGNCHLCQHWGWPSTVTQQQNSAIVWPASQLMDQGFLIVCLTLKFSTWLSWNKAHWNIYLVLYFLIFNFFSPMHKFLELSVSEYKQFFPGMGKVPWQCTLPLIACEVKSGSPGEAHNMCLSWTPWLHFTYASVNSVIIGSC